MPGLVRPAVRLARPTGGSCGGPQRLRGGVGLPVPGQQLVQLMALGAAGDDALQHIGQPGQWIEPFSFAVVRSEARIAQLRAPRSEPAKR